MKIPTSLYGISSYVLWGLFPFYYDLVSFANQWEVLGHRVFWSAVLILPIVLVTTRLTQVLELLKKYYVVLSITAVLMGLNWLLYIYSIFHGDVLATSLGYFMSPLISVILGVIVFKETLNSYQKIAFVLALLGVIIKTWANGELPWTSIGLALLFSCYGMMHKRNKLPADTSLFIECWILIPISLPMFYYLSETTHISFGQNWQQSILLVLLGVTTLTPLWLFIQATKSMKLSTLGFLFFITPSISFGFGVFYFHEPISLIEIVSFACIWLALLLVTFCSNKKPVKAIAL